MQELVHGIAEMEAVANRLRTWTDRLENVLSSVTHGEDEQDDFPLRALATILGAGPEVTFASAPASGDSAPVAEEAAPAAASAADAVSAADAGGDAVSADAPGGDAEENLPPVTLEDARAYLAEVCARGYGPQVKALITSYGVSSLRDVPAESYRELMRQVALLVESGGDDRA